MCCLIKRLWLESITFIGEIRTSSPCCSLSKLDHLIYSGSKDKVENVPLYLISVIDPLILVIGRSCWFSIKSCLIPFRSRLRTLLQVTCNWLPLVSSSSLHGIFTVTVDQYIQPSKYPSPVHRSFGRNKHLQPAIFCCTATLQRLVYMHERLHDCESTSTPLALT